MAFRQSIFRKLLTAAFILITVTLLSADFLLTRFIERREQASAQQEVQKVVRILAGTLPTTAPNDLQKWVGDADRESGFRVTVIDSHGVVLADSEYDRSGMENHGSRAEVRSALAGNAAGEIRHSATMDMDFYYFAAPVNIAGSGRFVLRVAVPLEHVAASIAAVQWLILRASVFAIAIALPIGYLVARSLARRIRRVQEYAAGLVKADYSGSLSIEADDEFGALARSLRSMASQFRNMMTMLSQESSRRSAIMSSMMEGVLAVNRELRVTFCNEAFARIVRARAPIAEKAPLTQLVRDPAFRALLVRVLSSGELARERINLLEAKGRTFEVQATPFHEDGDRGVIATLHDITELERLERIRRDFVANISHELRTPLSAIQGYTETLLDGALEDSQNNRKFLQIIAANAARLNDLAEDVLALSDLEASRNIPVERVSVLEIAENALRIVEPQANMCSVRAFLGAVNDVFIAGQSFRLERALVNLLQNGIKYNRAGGEVHIDIQRVENSVRIDVCDTGIGISQRELSRIFERFYRIDKARSRLTGGTGLGLSIVKHTVEQMGGFVTVQSEADKGSTFTLVFPAA